MLTRVLTRQVAMYSIVCVCVCVCVRMYVCARMCACVCECVGVQVGDLKATDHVARSTKM